MKKEDLNLKTLGISLGWGHWDRRTRKSLGHPQEYGDEGSEEDSTRGRESIDVGVKKYGFAHSNKSDKMKKF